jgi:hypothetical protein
MDLLLRLQPQQFIRRYSADEVGDFLRHAVIPHAEDLDHAGIVDERVRLIPIDLQLRRVLPGRCQTGASGFAGFQAR